jgi:hypothetical protein
MKRIISSLTLLFLVGGMLTVGATKAFFSDTETSVANVLTAGAIDLKVDNESYYNGLFNENTSWLATDLTIEKFFDFDDVKPGDYGEDTISLHVDTNDSFLCADVTLTSNNENGQTEPETLVDNTAGATDGELAQAVNFLWWADDGDNVLETDEEVISQGSLGGLALGEAFPLTLADSDENIWTGQGGPVPGDTTLYIGKAWCFGEMDVDPIPQDNADDVMSPALDNDDNNVAGEPEDGGIVCDGSLLGNVTQTDSLTADVNFSAVQARHNSRFQCRAPQVACSPVQAYADEVIATDQGTKKDGSPVDPTRSNPAFALGAPQSSGAPFDNPVVPSSFYSLGFKQGTTTGGSITVAFTDNIIVDGPGNDLRAWEITGGTSYPIEKVKIEVSQDGATWYPVASSVDRDAEADLAGSGLAWARYVRLTDVSGPAGFEATADGYDLDAFSALNCRAPLVSRDI